MSQRPYSLHVHEPGELASNLTGTEVQLAFVDAREQSGLFERLAASRPHQLRLFQDNDQASLADVLDQSPETGLFAQFLNAVRQCLRATGHILVLCDSATSHKIREALDTVFGPNHFRNAFVLPGNDSRRE